MENGYVIAWVSLQTGFEGIGTRRMTKAPGEQWIQSLNQHYDGVLLHWLVRAKGPTNGATPNRATTYLTHTWTPPVPALHFLRAPSKIDPRNHLRLHGQWHGSFATGSQRGLGATATLVHLTGATTLRRTASAGAPSTNPRVVLP